MAYSWDHLGNSGLPGHGLGGFVRHGDIGRQAVSEAEGRLPGPVQHAIGHHLEFHRLVVPQIGLSGDGGRKAHSQGIAPAAEGLAGVRFWA